MEGRQEVKKPRLHGGRKAKSTGSRYTFEFKLKAVKLSLEEGFSHALICKEMGMCESSLAVWLGAYRRHGEAGLLPRPLPPPGGGGGRGRLHGPVEAKIVELKRQNPWWGSKRIAQVLGRMFLLKASPETVRTRLKEAGLVEKPPPRHRRNLTRPRFFERATPNQMWQSDIFTFRLGGRYAYLIAFLDDYSRFVVGAELFRSPTAAAVIELYRVAIGEYRPPREMLTDNGRQYATWRGTSRFQAELKKDGVAHIRSRPQHPMTLGKVERFWSSIWREFLCRAQFESFESARERIKLWVAYYNHKRPHQGIGGLCPADRYFEIQSGLRKTIEEGMKENLLEMALRGQPRAPFYMVGRMEGQSVVLRAEKGKLKLSVGAEGQPPARELEYDLGTTTTTNDNESKGATIDERIQTTQDGEQNAPSAHAGAQLQRTGEGPGGAGGVDGAGAPGGSLPPDDDQLDHVQPVAEPGDGGYAPGAGEPGEPEQGRRPEPEAPGVACQAGASGVPGGALGAAGETPGLQAQGGGGAQEELSDGRPTASPAPGGGDPPGALRADHRPPGSQAPGDLAQGLLSVGEARASGNARRLVSEGSGTPPEAERSRNTGLAPEDRAIGKPPGAGRTDGGGPRGAHGHASGGAETRR
jgi:transposase InsO family protein